MFRPMRRIAQQMPDAQAKAVLAAGTSGVLAVAGDEGYPYAVPLSYVYDGNDRLYFHCATSGHKLDALRRCDKASFCVVAADDVMPRLYTTAYESVIAFGRVRELTDAQQKRHAALLLARRYAPNAGDACHEAEIDKYQDRLCVLEMFVEGLTGKVGLERKPDESQEHSLLSREAAQ